MSRARRSRAFVIRAGVAPVAVAASALLVAGQLATMSTASAAPPAPQAAATFIDLGAAATYSVLGGTAVTNTGAGTVLAGDLGLSPTGAITGFPLGTVMGATHDKDAAAAAAQIDAAAAYVDAAGQPSTSPFSGDQAGETFHPGVHTSAAAFANTGTMTLDADGDASAVFIFQIGAAFSPAAGSEVVLTDGALANNVFWQVAGAASLGANADYVGTILGAGAITFGDGDSMKGRALTSGTVTMTNTPFTWPVDDLTAPVVTIDGGPARATNDTTPSITGTTDEPAGGAVTVTVGGQTLNTTVDVNGAWGVSANALSSGPHDVVASVTDASQNTGTATQILTVDVTAPAVTIDGGASRSTNDATPSISGTTNAPAGTAVSVTVGGQTLSATASTGGTWTVGAATLSEQPHTVVASVTDAAQNTGTASQTLSVDVTVPVIAVDGGAARSTSDTSPWIYGTTGEQAGTTVDVSIGSQNLTATVVTGGTWGVSAITLSEGPHNVVASVTDAAGNMGTANQTLTVDVTAPAVSINGGASRSTNDATPSISGTTDAPAGSAVSVTVGGQTLSTTVGTGTWSVEAAMLTEGPHNVVATVTDAAGNTGTANQTLTVDVTAPAVSINGGASRSTNDATPSISGTTDAPAGSAVSVTVGGQTLSTTVGTGTWSVEAAILTEGPHNVVATVTDATQNTGTANQTLTVTAEPEARYQPDAAIRAARGTFVGAGIYDLAHQRVTKLLRGDARTAWFEVRVTNRGDSTDRMKIRATPSNKRFKATYRMGGRDVTPAVTANMYRTHRLAPGQSVRLFIKVVRTRVAGPGNRRTFEVRTVSSHARTSGDTVAAIVRVARGSGRSSP